MFHDKHKETVRATHRSESNSKMNVENKAAA